MTFNPYDLAALQQLIEEHKGEQAVYSGFNAKGEKCIINTFADRVVVHIKKWSGYILSITYWPNGEREEVYSGSWLKRKGDY